MLPVVHAEEPKDDMRRLAAILLVALLTSTLPSRSTRPLFAQPANPDKPINHIIILYEENHSFDNLYGSFPGAQGLANATTAEMTQMDKQGKPYDTLPAPLAAAVGPAPRQPDPRFPADLANKPFMINNFVSTDDKTGDMIHAFYREQYQIDGGKMDKFAAWSDGAGLAMGYWDASGQPLYELAKQYTVADDFFHAAFGGSFLNHFWLVCACTPVWPDAPADAISVPFPDDPDHMQDKNVSPDGYAINTSYTVNTPHPSTTAPDHLVPNQTMATIGDELSAANVTWAWFSGGWNDALAGHPDPLFQFHHQPFAYFANYADGTEAKEEHLKDESDFERSLTDGTLPSVSFIKPLGPDNEHPGYADISQGEQHAVKLINEIQASPYWSDTAIIVTYDEHGGSWDHVAPPIVDRWGPGLRVPTIVISPLAKTGYVDHTQYDTTSILKFIEWRWDLNPLGPRDAAANNLLNAFKFGGQ
jgi:phospholipase C